MSSKSRNKSLTLMYKYFIVYAGTSATLNTLIGNTDVVVNDSITLEDIRQVEKTVKERNNFLWCGVTNIVLLETDNSDVIEKQKKIQVSRLRRRYLSKF